jgi:hypothetical protein
MQIGIRKNLAKFAIFFDINSFFLRDDIRKIKEEEHASKWLITKDNQNDIRNKLANIFFKAEKEIELIRRSCVDIRKKKEKTQAAFELLEQSPFKFRYVTVDHLSEEWFDSSHGLRNAQDTVFLSIAKQRGICLPASAARKLYNAKRSNLPIPPIKFHNCLPE